MSFDYIKDPSEIYAQSFKAIEAGLIGKEIAEGHKNIIHRMIHACGVIDIIDDIILSPDLADAGCEALKNGAPIICDCEMVKSGIGTKGQPVDNPIYCTLNDPEVFGIAAELKTTRSAAAVQLWRPHLDGAIVVIGNAPTALFALLELLDGVAEKPAAILGFPVGFVGAAESKDALSVTKNVAFGTLLGRMGGSAIASAAFNGLLKEARERGIVT